MRSTALCENTFLQTRQEEHKHCHEIKRAKRTSS
jgi:hypothetical protein